jgi:hypothetical protein
MKNLGTCIALALACMSGAVLTHAVLAQPTAPVFNEAPVTQGNPQRTLLSLRFDDADIAHVMAAIAEQGKVEIVVSNDLGGKIRPLRLKDVTAEQAIRCVAAATNLEWRKLDNKTYLIMEKLPVVESDNNGEQRLPGQSPPTQSPRRIEPPSQGGNRTIIIPQTPASVTKIQNGIKVISPDPRVDYKLYVGKVQSSIDPKMIIRPSTPEALPLPPLPDILRNIPIIPRIPALPGLPPVPPAK